jgi:hypothetical protein
MGQRRLTTAFMHPSAAFMRERLANHRLVAAGDAWRWAAMSPLS